MSAPRDHSQVRLRGAGHVYLVGAGPGDPELLTVRAHRILARARVVAYDELVSEDILAIAPPDAERIPVGRRRGTCPDAPPIHPKVLERALEGVEVVRLKGGDPMIFGRGGEEAEELAALGISFEVVPGISAAIGASASSGIPLTHREVAASVTFATAHRRSEHEGAGSHLGARVPAEGTVVLYMGLATLRAAASELVAGGRRPETPVAVVSHATRPEERTIVADLATIADVVERREIRAPALVIVGDVVSRRVVSPKRLGSLGPSLSALSLPATASVPSPRSSSVPSPRPSVSSAVPSPAPPALACARRTR